MKKDRKELNWEQTEKLVTMALEEKNPLKLSKELSVRKRFWK
jgi:hypothetical protein